MTTSKIDDIIFREGAHTQQDFRQRILNLTGSKPHPHVSAINFPCFTNKFAERPLVQRSLHHMQYFLWQL